MTREVSSAAYQQVDEYARDRAEKQRDLYGWSRPEEELGSVAVFYVAMDADPASFPEEIGGVRIILRRLPAPRPLMAST